LTNYLRSKWGCIFNLTVMNTKPLPPLDLLDGKQQYPM
jgi:hypothetical protein